MDLKTLTINPQVVRMIPEDIARRYKALPIKLENNRLEVAMVHATDTEILEELQLLTGCVICPIAVSDVDMAVAFDRHFSVEKSTKQTLVELRKTPEKTASPIVASEFDSDDDASDHPVVKLFNSIISGAISKHASDIHLEPGDPEMRVRYRIDGVLHDVMAIPKQVETALISRAKIVSEMDITEKRRPQDGHYAFHHRGEKFDLRVACMHTVQGEKMVLRILDKSRMKVGISDLGFEDKDVALIKKLIGKPYGMILVTGPTGSGKTTSLYSMLNMLDKQTDNIVTIEAPVEYRLTGINQTQVNSQIGLTFAAGLKAFLRQDPDIILVGEIRDKETAEIAVQAALTGHLVLSTLHTNDAATAITRMVEMGIEPFLLASTVIGVMAQRLARTQCKECHGAGCDTCFHTGMKGRTVLYELLEVNPEIRKLILSEADVGQIKQSMTHSGMTTFQRCAAEKISQKLITEEEMKRVVFE